MKEIKVSQIMDSLKDASYEELVPLYDQLLVLVKAKQAARSFVMAQSFKVGEEVTFTESRTSQNVVGTIEKINVKSIKVRTELGVWSVSPTLLKKVV